MFRCSVSFLLHQQPIGLSRTNAFNDLNEIFMKCMEMILNVTFFKGMLPAIMFAASIGTAGVPGAGMIMLAMVLTSVELPVDGIALVAGVDRIFDMGRTTVNITGDAACNMVVSNLEAKRETKKS